MQDYATWSRFAETLETLEVNRNIIQDTYKTPNGIYLHHRVYLPWNPFAKQSEYVSVSYILQKTPSVEALVLSFSGELDCEDSYTEEGYGIAFFKGEQSMENAYNFSQKLSTRPAHSPDY